MNQNKILVKRFVDKGMWIFPCELPSKKPFQGWKWTKHKLGPHNIQQWIETAKVFATEPAKCGLWICDIDEAAEMPFGKAKPEQQKNALEAVLKRLGPPLAKCRSKGKTKGWHLFYKLHKKDRNHGPASFTLPDTNGAPMVKGDIRCKSGYVIIWEPQTLQQALEKASKAAAIRISRITGNPDHSTTTENHTDTPHHTTDEIRAVLAELNLDERQDWLECGMALHDHFQGHPTGLKLWDEFSRKFDKYTPTGCTNSWKSFKNNRTKKLTIGTLLKKANKKRESNRKKPLKITKSFKINDLAENAPKSPETTRKTSKKTLSEYNLSRIFLERYSAVCKYDSSQWWTYQQKTRRWTEGSELVKQRIWRILVEQAPDPGPRTDISKKKWAAMASLHKSICKNSTCNAVLAICQTTEECRIEPDIINSKKHLLGLPNGECWNLITNEIRPANATDMLTKSLGAKPSKLDHRKTALYAVLIEALQPHYQDDSKEVVEYLTKIMGHFLASDHTQEVFLDFTGPAGGGKSLQAEFWRTAFGEYASAISSAMADSRGNAHPEWKLSLANGNRLVIASDVNSGRFDADAITAATSGETLSARGMHQQSRDIKPTAGILICNNDVPKGSGGIFRRIRLIHFRKALPHSKQDRGLKAKISDSATLGAWLGAARNAWLSVKNADRQDAQMPRKMLNDCLRYQENNDTVSGFVNQFLRAVNPDLREYELADEIYRIYDEYIEECSIPRKLSKPRLMSALDSGPWNFVYSRRHRDGKIRVRAMLHCRILTEAERNAAENTPETPKSGVLGQNFCPFSKSFESEKIFNINRYTKGTKKMSQVSQAVSEAIEEYTEGNDDDEASQW